MWYFEIAYKNVQQRKTRTVLTAAGLAVAVTAITAIWNIAWGYAQYATSYYAARNVDVVVVRAGISDRLTSSLRSELAQRLRSLPGIKSVDGGLTEMVSLGETKLIGIPLRGFEPDGFTVAALTIIEGRNLRSSDQGGILLGSGIAALLGKHAGQQLEIEGTPFDVLGVFQSANPFEMNSVVARLSDVQSLMDRPGIVSEFQICAAESIRDDAALNRLCHTIEKLRDDQENDLGLKAQPTHQFVESATEAVLGTAMAWGTSAIVLALSMVGMLNTMLMSVIERTRELGILRAIGWTRSRVIQMILGESVLISLVGAVVGLTAAATLTLILSKWPATSMFVPKCLSWAAMALGVGGAILPAIAGALYPAYYAADVLPTEALRYE
jgi:putative ABC transport system permease protein